METQSTTAIATAFACRPARRTGRAKIRRRFRRADRSNTSSTSWSLAFFSRPSASARCGTRQACKGSTTKGCSTRHLLSLLAIVYDLICLSPFSLARRSKSDSIALSSRHVRLSGKNNATPTPPNKKYNLVGGGGPCVIRWSRRRRWCTLHFCR